MAIIPIPIPIMCDSWVQQDAKELLHKFDLFIFSRYSSHVGHLCVVSLPCSMPFKTKTRSSQCNIAKIVSAEKFSLYMTNLIVGWKVIMVA